MLAESDLAVLSVHREAAFWTIGCQFHPLYCSLIVATKGDISNFRKSFNYNVEAAANGSVLTSATHDCVSPDIKIPSTEILFARGFYFADRINEICDRGMTLSYSNITLEPAQNLVQISADPIKPQKSENKRSINDDSSLQHAKKSKKKKRRSSGLSSLVDVVRKNAVVTGEIVSKYHDVMTKKYWLARKLQYVFAKKIDAIMSSAGSSASLHNIYDRMTPIYDEEKCSSFPADDVSMV